MRVYLDYAASTPPCEGALRAAERCMRERWANPSAVYASAGDARRELRLARVSAAKLIGCDVSEVYFTSGGTESNGWAALACAGRHAVVSAAEHASVLESVKRHASEVTYVQPDANGVIRPEAVAEAMRGDTALVSVQWANNETGVIQPVRDIAKAVRPKALFHVDAVQAAGHVPVDASLCDLMSLSAHKFYGVRGAGALYVRMGVSIPPLLAGGHQESGLRAGTENTPAIAAMGAAAEAALTEMHGRACEERELMKFFAENLRMPDARVLGGDAERLPGIMALYLPGCPAEAVIAKMDMLGIAVSGGAACASASHEPSHVYRAMGLSERDAACVIRVSIGRGVTKEALAHAAQALNDVTQAMRNTAF